MFRYMKLVDMLKEVREGGRQIKSVVYQNKQLKAGEVAASCSLINLVINNYNKFQSCCEEIQNRTGSTISNRDLLIVMMGELVNTGKIVGGGKLKKMIMDNQQLLADIDKKSKMSKPFVQLRLRQSDKDYKMLDAIVRLNGDKDELVPNLYHLPYEKYSQLTKDQGLALLKIKGCVMQSLSSCLPPYLLLFGVQEKWKGKKFDVVDACSAPGNKTIQLAEYIAGNGTVMAFEKNVSRYQLLQKTLKKYKVQNVVSYNKNFLEVHRHDLTKQVKFIMLDPSCSGSGMLVNFTRDSKGELNLEQSFQQFCRQRYEELSEQQKLRVDKLHKFQVQLLSHAAKLDPLRLSYSTCSIYKRENEDVIKEFLQKHPQYKIKRFNISHSCMRSGFGKKYSNCIRIDPRCLKTDGFFVTVLVRKREEIGK